jgi:predicted permease
MKRSLRSWLWRVPIEQEVDEEIAFHLEMRTRELIAGGMDPALAHETALARAGDLTRLRESCMAIGRKRDREMRLTQWLEELRDDVTFAIRQMKASPAFTLVAALTLALGIGGNAVIFSAVDAMLLRDPAVTDPDRLVVVYTSDASGNNPYGNSSYPDYVDLRDSGIFDSLSAQGSVSIALDARGQTETLAGDLVSGNYFDVLGVRIPFGRAFVPSEDQIGSPAHVAIISHALWRRVFNSDASLIGGTIRLNGRPYTLIGVAPRGFPDPIFGRATDVWVPWALAPEVDPPSSEARGTVFERRGSRGLDMIGRLPTSGSMGQVTAAANVIAIRLQAAYPDSNRNRAFTAAALGEGRGRGGVRAAARPRLQQLGGAVAMVLLIACANVACLLLARAVSRQREVAVRIAIGAGRARLTRQWLAESLLLAALGSTGALLVAWWGTPLLHTFGVPEGVELSLNGRVLGFTMLVAAGSALLFGLAPVFQTLRDDTMAALREEGGAVATGARAMRMRSTFVTFQIAVSLVLLVGAGLYLRTLEHAYSVDLGYQVDQTLVTDRIDLDVHGYSEDAGLTAYEQILAGVEAIPGVSAAGLARSTVLTGARSASAVSADGRPIQPDESNARGVYVNTVSPRYFQAMNIPIVRGRPFAASDRQVTERVAIVDQWMTDRLWPDVDPIGKVLWDENDRPLVVIGVVPDTVYTSPLVREPPTVYLPLAQNYVDGAALHVRATGDPVALVPAIREAVRQVDSRVSIDGARRLRDVLDQSLGRQRMMGTLIGLFGAIALLLAVIGLYGVMSHATTHRTPEIGIRLALGARRASVLTLMVWQGVRLIAIGSAIGVAVALVTTRLIASQLFGVEPTDPLTFAAACVVLALAGLAASAIPARRAMRVDPIVALRRA